MSIQKECQGQNRVDRHQVLRFVRVDLDGQLAVRENTPGGDLHGRDDVAGPQVEVELLVRIVQIVHTGVNNAIQVLFVVRFSLPGDVLAGRGNVLVVGEAIGNDLLVVAFVICRALGGHRVVYLEPIVDANLEKTADEVGLVD